MHVGMIPDNGAKVPCGQVIHVDAVGLVRYCPAEHCLLTHCDAPTPEKPTEHTEHTVEPLPE